MFLHKFHEAIVLSSWGFVLLGSPMLLAYGVVVGAPWYYYAMLLPFMVAFIYIPVAIGAILCLLVVRHIPDRIVGHADRRRHVAVGCGGAWMAWQVLTGPKNDLLTPGWFQEILGRLQVSDQRLLPSWWLSTGLLAAADRRLGREPAVPDAVDLQRPASSASWPSGPPSGSIAPAYSGLCGKRCGANAPDPCRSIELLSRLMRFASGDGAADDDQGPAAVSPRPVAVVADSSSSSAC